MFGIAGDRRNDQRVGVQGNPAALSRGGSPIPSTRGPIPVVVPTHQAPQNGSSFRATPVYSSAVRPVVVPVAVSAYPQRAVRPVVLSGAYEQPVLQTRVTHVPVPRGGIVKVDTGTFFAITVIALAIFAAISAPPPIQFLIIAGSVTSIFAKILIS